MLKYCYTIGLIFFSSLIFSLTAQVNNPNWSEAYVQDAVPKIEVTIDPADFTWLLTDSNLTKDEYQEVQFVYTDSDGNPHNFSGAGMRLRGNTSRFAQKKSFKLHVEKFGGEDLFYDLEKINLKGSHNDPSIIRERLAYYFMREMGGATPRVNNLALYINNEYRGLYVNVEQIDNEFMKMRFGNKSGNLYKCLYGASLRNSDDVWNNSVFELKTNENINDRSDLIELIDVLNNTSDAEFKTEIEQVLDVDHLLKYLAVEVLTGHWDGYSFNKNNYYLYHNTSTGLFEVIMYDVDNTFGIDWFGIDWAVRNIYDWGTTSEDRPLFWRILDVPEYRATYTENIRTLLNGMYQPDSIFPVIDTWMAQNHDYAMDDTYRTMDYGFDSTAFVNSPSVAWGAHVKYGIKPFIQKRYTSALEQLDYPFSVNELIANSNVRMSQKPGELILTFDDNSEVEYRLSIYDLSGKLVKTITVSDKQTIISLPSGVFVGTLENANAPISLKVFIP